ncbi:hypothetical protein [Thermococcus sp.]|uniref:hypothetical protein n=1 Tax=Thermococcus sp. TaxID=35749 RepID=UPI00262A31D5|nr:hypothetical protein [Thermococcus sp.]MCD6143684.1 hypothetical protein [Thermococcus sp.]
MKREDIVIKTTVHEFLQAYGLDTDNEGRITGKQRIETVKNALKRLKNRDVVIEWDSKIMYDSLIHAFVIDTKTKELEVQCHPIFDAFGRIEKRYILRSLSKDKIIKELAANRIRPHLTRLTDWLETLDIEIIKIRTTKLGKIAGLKYATSKDKGRLLKSLSNLLDLAKKGQWLLDWKLQKEENNFEIFLNPLLCRRLTHVSNFAEWLYEQQTSIEEKQKTIQITAEKISDICRKKLTKQAIRRLLRWMQQANQITWSENKQTYTITIFEKPAISITLSNL